MKYIDAEKLKYEIERRNLSNYHTTTEGYEEELYEIIDSLEQEQPEVDLEKEVRIYCGSSFRFNYDELNDSFYSNAFEFDDVVELARHFYKLGLKARKED